MFVCFFKCLVAVELQLQQSFQRNVKNKKFEKLFKNTKTNLIFKVIFLKTKKNLNNYFFENFGGAAALQFLNTSRHCYTGIPQNIGIKY